MPKCKGETDKEYRARLAANRDTPNHLSANQQRYFELLDKNPYLDYKESARLLGLSKHTIEQWHWTDENFKRVFDEFIQNKWNSLLTGAVNNVQTLIEECDWTATKYVLDNKGFGAKQKVEATIDANVNVINITLDDEE